MNGTPATVDAANMAKSEACRIPIAGEAYPAVVALWRVAIPLTTISPAKFRLARHRVGAADEHEPKLWHTQLLVELRVPTSRDIDLEGVLRLLAYTVVKGIPSGVRGERRGRVCAHVVSLFARRDSSPRRR